MDKPTLKECSACGGKISQHSLACPHCGHPQGSRVMLWVLGLFALLLIAFFVAFYCYCACLCK
ncbi:MAG: hypothetical protein K9N51_01945 [Candidatus Pacebacteria bacterium]|nr:hypothetical protein [Candidatus Paceibacterota bacterium]